MRALRVSSGDIGMVGMYVVILHLFGKPRHYAQVLISDLCLNKVNNITSTYMKAIKPTYKVVTDDI